jgi:hypothetical protein
MMARGSGALPSAQADRIPTSLTLIEDFDPLLHRLETLLTQLVIIGDRIGGSQPTSLGPKDGAANPVPPPPGHLIAALVRRREALLLLVDALETEIERIATGIG